MCGIAGIMGTWSPSVAERAVASMIQAIAHRGPDGQGMATLSVGAGETTLALAHARLSILDLSDAASQPMRHDATGSWLIFNGELYNYRELRHELAALGHQFQSTGDTEVLLAALVQWGADALPKLNGMYALAFWDGVRQHLLLTRDPLGIKPILIARTLQGVLFGSEVRALLASGLVESRLSTRAVRSFLTYGAVVGPETICDSIVSIPPGTVVEIDAAGRARPPRPVGSLEQMLHLNQSQPIPDEGFDAGLEKVATALRGAVRRHLISDVRLGVLLSSGVDSSLLAALASEAQDTGIELVTVGFDEKRFSEVAFAKAIADRLPGRHLVINLNARELESMVPDALRAMDQPTVDGVNVFVVSSLAAKAGIRVLLSGLGADEVFGGYTTFRRVPSLTRIGGLVSGVAPLLARLDPGRAVQWSKLGSAKRVKVLRDAYLLQRAIHWGPSHPAMPQLSGPPDDHQMPPETWEQLVGAASLDAFREVSFLEMTFYMRHQLLRDADIFSSAVAVEMRVPYLDHEVVRAAWAVRGRHHLSRFGDKRILRRLLQQLIPGLQHPRRKMGFTFPWNEWLKGPLSSLVGDVLNSPSHYASVGLDPARGRRMLDQFRTGSATVSWFHVWSLFVLLHWQSERRLRAS